MVKPAAAQRGMIYLVLLLALAAIGGAAAVNLQLAETARLRAGETELLFIGGEFRRALQSYAEATPVGFPAAPLQLEELLRDARAPGIRRHLRRLYVDPLTGRADWQIERGIDGRITAVRSRSHTPTFRQENFSPEDSALAGARFHDEWRFAGPAPLPGPEAATGFSGRPTDLSDRPASSPDAAETLR